MFSSGPSYSKLKTNLRLAINRLKLLEKKKTELTQKARKEIADYIGTGKIERAKIRVEHIIREDYLVEAMEVTEMYCDLVLARFGLVQQMKDLDPGLSEALSSLIWCAPRLMTDVPELKVVADQLALKYGKPYAMACREQSVSTISEKLIHKLSVQAPPKVLVEKYLQEIALNYNLEYTPDPQVMREADWGSDPLISLDDPNNPNNQSGGGASGGASGGGGGGGGMPQQPFSYPPNSKAAEAMASGDLNLPNVPGMAPYPAAGQPPPPFSYPNAGSHAPQPFNYPNAHQPPFNYSHPGNGPPPAPAVEPGADSVNSTTGGQYPGGGHSNWDEMLGLDTSPPPPYTSIDNKSGGMQPPTAPPPSMPSLSPPHHKTHFPPDLNTSPGDGGSSSSSTPQPAPRSKFEGGAPAAAGGGDDLGFSLPDLPNVPSSASNTKPDDPSPNNDEIDFDDLNKRFQELKKK